MKDFIYCIIWLSWRTFSHIVGVFDHKVIFGYHWTNKIEPVFIRKYIANKYGCMMNRFEAYRLLWWYDYL